ncbi:hypothetical protein BKA59DRAFT_488481 [Fusarium tricinctum]|uniref:Uncharacterized protein n=1 Tax=Fusarium tricinctum TaxID=61284 RepID=A0A8K0RP25_9HYPO|nr:hypothetical protein BKA59DRAFT_488481 [Fusarium tricinctum]
MGAPELINEIRSIVRRVLPYSRRLRRNSWNSQHSQDSQRSQDISARDIDPKKLMKHLSSAFTPNSFQVDLVHNMYTIRAPRLLTKKEIENCC